MRTIVREYRIERKQCLSCTFTRSHLYIYISNIYVDISYLLLLSLLINVYIYIVAAKYNVSAMPTFVLIKSGQVIDRLMGANVERLRELIDENK
jgi:Thioredoxin